MLKNYRIFVTAKTYWRFIVRELDGGDLRNYFYKSRRHKCNKKNFGYHEIVHRIIALEERDQMI